MTPQSEVARVSKIVDAMTGLGTPAHMLARTDSPDTSKAAAESVSSAKLEEVVLTDVASFGDDGCIQDDVLAKHAGQPYSSITARFAALLRKGLIEDTGHRRSGRSGRLQRVLRVTQSGTKVLAIIKG